VKYTVPVKLRRLRGRKTSARILRDGAVWKSRTFVARWIAGPPRGETAAGLFVGTFASGKLSKSAVERNRMRRRCREALRRAVRERDEVRTAQVLLSPRKTSLDCPFRDIEEDVGKFLAVLR